MSGTQASVWFKDRSIGIEVAGARKPLLKRSSRVLRRVCGVWVVWQRASLIAYHPKCSTSTCILLYLVRKSRATFNPIVHLPRQSYSDKAQNHPDATQISCITTHSSNPDRSKQTHAPTGLSSIRQAKRKKRESKNSPHRHRKRIKRSQKGIGENTTGQTRGKVSI